MKRIHWTAAEINTMIAEVSRIIEAEPEKPEHKEALDYWLDLRDRDAER
jgi:hypothetical protein